jgi:hypothetical protein
MLTKSHNNEKATFVNAKIIAKFSSIDRLMIAELNNKEKPLTATLEHRDAQSEPNHDLTLEEIRQCDELAQKYLMISKQELKKSRKIQSQFHSVYYKESSADGGALLVCTDGSVLFAGSFVPKNSHFLAFENGLRTKTELLLERKSLNEEWESSDQTEIAA